MTYNITIILLIVILILSYIICIRKTEDAEHPLSVILIILTILMIIGSFFFQGWMFKFDEPVCIKENGYVETVYSWRHQEKTFDHNGETHKMKELLDYDKINLEEIPDSVMVFKYIYEDFGFIRPSKEFFVYSENPTKYTLEGACQITVETK